ncbi:MAG: T9SS type A sorting domain-containing protein, partial [Bacteroidota bacterium]
TVYLQRTSIYANYYSDTMFCRLMTDYGNQLEQEDTIPVSGYLWGLYYMKQFLSTDTVFFLRDNTFGHLTVLCRADQGIAGFYAYLYNASNPLYIPEILKYHFLTKDIGYLVQYSWTSNWDETSYLLKYHYGTVDSIYSDSTYLLSLYFINENTGFVYRNDTLSGHYNVIKTADGGNNWQICLDSVSSAVQSWKFINNSTGYILLADHRIIKTSDQGNTWDYLQMDYALFGNNCTTSKVSFVDDGLIYIPDTTGRIMKTYDDGLNFVYDSLINDHIRQIDIFSDSLGYVVTTDGRLFRKPYRNITSVIKYPEQANSGKLLVFPNPTTGLFSIEAENILDIKVNDVNGRPVYTGKTKEIDLSGWPAGVYTIKVTTNNWVLLGKVVLE